MRRFPQLRLRLHAICVAASFTFAAFPTSPAQAANTTQSEVARLRGLSRTNLLEYRNSPSAAAAQATSPSQWQERRAEALEAREDLRGRPEGDVSCRERRERLRRDGPRLGQGRGVEREGEGALGVEGGVAGEKPGRRVVAREAEARAR